MVDLTRIIRISELSGDVVLTGARGDKLRFMKQPGNLPQEQLVYARELLASWLTSDPEPQAERRIVAIDASNDLTVAFDNNEIWRRSRNCVRQWEWFRVASIPDSPKPPRTFTCPCCGYSPPRQVAGYSDGYLECTECLCRWFTNRRKEAPVNKDLLSALKRAVELFENDSLVQPKRLEWLEQAQAAIRAAEERG